MDNLSRFLPPFPHTIHLPWYPNPGHGDSVAKEGDIQILGAAGVQVHIEEKVDGSSVGVTFIDGHPVVRNKDHILQKGFLRKIQDTPAKMQFRPLWNWVYENADKFKALEWVEPDRVRPVLESCGFTVAPKVAMGPLTPDEYLALAHRPSAFTSTEPAEGIYLKVARDGWIVDRFKMVREDFVQGRLWNDETLNKNKETTKSRCKRQKDEGYEAPQKEVNS